MTPKLFKNKFELYLVLYLDIPLGVKVQQKQAKMDFVNRENVT